jgi:hypothetical protein
MRPRARTARPRRLHAAFAAVAAMAGAALVPASAHAFGIAGFEAIPRAAGGGAETLSGSHPYALTVGVAFDASGSPPRPEGEPRSLRIELAPGMVVNPAVVPACGLEDFHKPRSSPYEASRSGESCPAYAQVGTVEVHSGAGAGAVRRFGLFELPAAPGAVAQLGFAPFGQPVAFALRLRDEAGGHGISLEADEVPAGLQISELDLSLWGTPWAASHDGERGECLNEAEPAFPWAKCSVGPPAQKRPLAYLTMPATCGAPLVFAAAARSWTAPGEASAAYAGPGMQRCGELRFEPVVTGQLTDRAASSPSGFQLNLLANEEGLTDPAKRVQTQPRRAVVELPEGVTVNPSVGAGLGVCTPDQYAAETATSPPGAGCPSTSKIGDFAASTPLLAEEINGAIYLAQPFQNPSGSLLAVYLVARAAHGGGALLKVAGAIAADSGTGRLTATFDELPQLPYGSLRVNLRSGQRAPLVTPPSCGPARSAIELTPWSGGGLTVHAVSDWQIERGAGGGACPAGPPGFAPGAVAGALNSAGGAYTPYFVHLSRADTEQEITSYSLVLPEGITGRIAGVATCSDAAISAARGRLGQDERASPSCPAESRLGRTLTGYGVGAALTYSEGAVYLAGPYHGAPLSVVTIDPATVGPFDLGTIVIRSAFEVDPRTAQLRIDSAGSDPIPHIIDGFPLHLRDIRVYMDRPDFTRNPTGCEPSRLESTLTGSGLRYGDSSDDTTATASSFFQLLSCRELGFRPKLGLRLRGGHRRGAYPALRAVFAARPGDANLQRIAVTMPHSEFLAQNHIRKVCTRERFDAGNCPKGSIYGRAVAHTPLLDQPLRGPVLLRSSPHKLPDLVADLHSGAVRIVLAGRIGPAKHGIRTFFGGLPDAPIERFVLQMRGGRHGLLVNSTDICIRPPRATVKALGQNNRGRVFTTKLRGQCKHQRRERQRRRRHG